MNNISRNNGVLGGNVTSLKSTVEQTVNTIDSILMGKKYRIPKSCST